MSVGKTKQLERSGLRNIICSHYKEKLPASITETEIHENVLRN
jgi:hypothetical protein